MTKYRVKSCNFRAVFGDTFPLKETRQAKCQKHKFSILFRCGKVCNLRMVSECDPALLLSGDWTVCNNKVNESLEVVFALLSALNPSWKVQSATSSLSKEAWQGDRVEGLWFKVAPE